VTYDAPNQTDTDGNKYKAFGQAFAWYDTLAAVTQEAGGYYELPMNLDYDCTNSNAFSFLAGTNAFVDVNSNQQPTNVPDVGVNAVCGK